MDKDTYLILRVTGPEREAFDPLFPFGLRSDGSLESTGSVSAIEYQVDAQKLDAKHYAEVRRDPKTAAMARPMPLQLIEPVSDGGASAQPEAIHDATWGVFVTGALQSPYVGHGVTVAILDTGIDAGHEAFRGVELIQKDFTGEGDGDQNGHGTHVAGTIFGQTVEGVRYAVDPAFAAVIGKVIGKKLTATTKELIDAVQWAVDQGAHVINMSLGFNFPGLVRWWVETEKLEPDLATSRALAQYRDNVRFFDKLVDFLRARSVQNASALIVAAAGNESKRQIRPAYAIEVAPPAAADGIVAVAAVQSAGAPHDALTVAPFSNIRAAVAGPGVGIYSARKGGGFIHMNGTSMASPHVAGVAALWAERQLKRNGQVNLASLDAQVRASARRDRLKSATYMDVGEGLASAPLD